MFTCRDVIEQIAELVGGSLPAETRDALQQHVAGCQACRDYLEKCALAEHLGSGLPLPHPPRHLKSALEEECGG
jgi:hypothetical protein